MFRLFQKHEKGSFANCVLPIWLASAADRSSKGRAIYYYVYIMPQDYHLDICRENRALCPDGTDVTDIISRDVIHRCGGHR